MENHLEFWRLLWAVPFLTLLFSPHGSSAQDLPQLDQIVYLDQDESAKLAADFPNWSSGTSGFAGDVESLLISRMPAAMKGSCRNMPEPGGAGPDEVAWTVRLLHTADKNDRRQALIAYRCGFGPNPGSIPPFDERPAIVSLGLGSLTFFPLDRTGGNPSDFYSVKFVQTLPIPDYEVLQLEVTNTPRGGATGSSSRTQTLLVEWQGRIVLKIDSRDEFSGYDDKARKAYEKVCDTKLDYERGPVGEVNAIVSVTTCAEDKITKPSIRVRYDWDANGWEFRKSEPAITSPTSISR